MSASVIRHAIVRGTVQGVGFRAFVVRATGEARSAALEQLSPAETARVLEIKEKAAGMRYVRALRRLKEILKSLNQDCLDP